MILSTAERPSTIPCQLSAAFKPSGVIAPTPVTTILSLSGRMRAIGLIQSLLYCADDVRINGLLGHSYGILNCLRIGSSVSHNGNSIYSEENGPAIVGIIQAGLRRSQRASREQCPHHSQRTALNFPFYGLSQKSDNTFRGLNKHVPRETIRDEHINRLIENILALDIANEVKAAGF